MNRNTCCFFGHRKINITKALMQNLYTSIEDLIIKEKVDTFLFGSKSQFNNLCHEIICNLKKDYPHIKRIYVRAEFPYINDDYKAYLLESYEQTYYPDNILNAGKSAYIERNYEMINKSKFCIIYFDENYIPSKRRYKNTSLTQYQPKSGTKIAYDYALKKQRIIINVFKLSSL